MSDQDDPTRRENGQPPQYGPPPPQPPYVAPPPYGQPPHYGQPPQYPPPYGQPPYGPPPPYGQPPYGQPSQYPPPYGEPQYPTQQLSPYTGAAPANTGGGGGRRTGLVAGIGTLVVAGIVVLVLLLAGVFSGSAAAASPRDAVADLLDAGEHNDVTAAKKALCAADNRTNAIGRLQRNGRVTSYTIGKVVQRDGSHATVSVRITTVGGGSSSSTLPVRRENGHWKVCITDSAAPSLPSGLPSIALPSLPGVSIPPLTIPSIPGLPTLPGSLPSLGALSNPCALAPTAFAAATIYVGLAELGQVDTAQGCVDGSAVPRSTTASIKSGGDLYGPSGDTSGPIIEFTSIDATSKLEISVGKKSDGRFYVTKVEKS